MKMIPLITISATRVATPLKGRHTCLDPARCPRQKAITLPERGTDYFTKMSLSLVGEGGLLSEQAVQARLHAKGISSSEISAWLDEGNAALHPMGAQRWVPMFQLSDLGRPRADVAAVADELAGAMDDLEILAWFVCPNEALHRVTPLTALSSNFESVINAARVDHFLVAG